MEKNCSSAKSADFIWELITVLHKIAFYHQPTKKSVSLFTVSKIFFNAILFFGGNFSRI